MEAAGLAVGAVALVTMVSTIQDFADMITLEKHASDDARTCVVQSRLLSHRLQISREIMNLDDGNQE